MILFRYAWAIALVAVAGHFLTACLATSPKPFPEPGWPTLRMPAPVWLQQPSAVVDVAWIRGENQPARVRDGVCELRLPDNELGLYPAERQVLACIASGDLVTPATPPAGTVRVYWHQVRGIQAVIQRNNDLFMTPTYPRSGFYYHPKVRGPCHVVTSLDHYALGHEIKHCFDGLFHARGGRWLPVPAKELQKGQGGFERLAEPM